jgi:hypothetical protein
MVFVFGCCRIEVVGKKGRLALAKEQDSNPEVSSNCSRLPQHNIKTPVQAILQGAGMREVGSRPLGSGRCVAESKRIDIVRVSFDQTFQSSGLHIDLQHYDITFV